MNRAKSEFDARRARLVFIGQATPRHAAHFQRKFAPDVETILADEDRASYKAMGLRRGGAMQLIGPKSVLRGAGHLATSGIMQGRIIGDAAQLGGTFIVLPGGEVAWSHISDDASDNASVDEILAALTEAVG